jgi:hypothetical protein
MSAGDESAYQAEGFPAPNGSGDAHPTPAQVSFWLLEPAADAAMTYFYGQLFAMDTEIRAMFPAAMDVQRKRFFQALTRIVAGQDDRDPPHPLRSEQPGRLVPQDPAYLRYVPKKARIRCHASSAASGL